MGNQIDVAKPITISIIGEKVGGDIVSVGPSADIENAHASRFQIRNRRTQGKPKVRKSRSRDARVASRALLFIIAPSRDVPPFSDPMASCALVNSSRLNSCDIVETLPLSGTCFFLPDSFQNRHAARWRCTHWFLPKFSAFPVLRIKTDFGGMESPKSITWTWKHAAVNFRDAKSPFLCATPQ